MNVFVLFIWKVRVTYRGIKAALQGKGDSVQRGKWETM